MLTTVSNEMLAARLLFPVCILAVVASSDPLGHRSSVEVADLADVPLLLLQRSFASRGWFDAECHHDVYWFEEALKPEAIEDYVQLRQASPVAIAAGEVLTRRQTFRQWFVRGAIDIVQPDVTKVGGISEQRKIAWMANEFGVRYIGHGWNTALGVAADLQLASVFPETTFVEYIGGSPYVDGITKGGFAIDAEGYLRIPDRPGLGIELDRPALAKYTADPAPLFQP